MNEALQIRAFEAGDEPALFEVYWSAIHRVAAKDYSPEQIQAWAPRNLPPAIWRSRMQAIQPWIAIRGGLPVGYADLQASGYIDHFFVSGDCPRQGIGAALMNWLLQQAEQAGIALLSSNVSLTAQPFFTRHGFHVVEQRLPVLRGVQLPNALMHRHMAPAK